ncbi:MAG: hypothetical protein ABI183_24650 [Polyangiaceae bacterium]
MKRSWSLLILSSLSALGCGGKEQSASNSSSGDGGITNDKQPGSTSPLVGNLVAACPSVPPTEGSSCTALAQLCEYGDDLDSACNQVFNCNPNGTWGGEGGSGPGCPTSLKTCASDITSSTTCSAGDGVCQTSLGLCTCFDHTFGPTHAADSGAPPDTFAYSCASPDSACPAWPNRPRIGSACSQADLQCDYDPCGPNGFAFQCGSDGFWTDAFSSNCGGG